MNTYESKPPCQALGIAFGVQRIHDCLLVGPSAHQQSFDFYFVDSEVEGEVTANGEDAISKWSMRSPSYRVQRVGRARRSGGVGTAVVMAKGRANRRARQGWYVDGMADFSTTPPPRETV